MQDSRDIHQRGSKLKATSFVKVRVVEGAQLNSIMEQWRNQLASKLSLTLLVTVLIAQIEPR